MASSITERRESGSATAPVTRLCLLSAFGGGNHLPELLGAPLRGANLSVGDFGEPFLFCSTAILGSESVLWHPIWDSKSPPLSGDGAAAAGECHHVWLTAGEDPGRRRVEHRR